jgi:hypothetical protein
LSTFIYKKGRDIIQKNIEAIERGWETGKRLLDAKNGCEVVEKDQKF